MSGDCRRPDPHEHREPLVFLLLALDELQGRWLVTAEGTHCSLYLLFLLTTELEDRHTHTMFTQCSGHNTCLHLLQVTVTQLSGFFHLPKYQTEGLVKKILRLIEREKYWTHLMLIKTHALFKCAYVVRAVGTWTVIDNLVVKSHCYKANFRFMPDNSDLVGQWIGSYPCQEIICDLTNHWGLAPLPDRRHLFCDINCNAVREEM